MREVPGPIPVHIDKNSLAASTLTGDVVVIVAIYVEDECEEMSPIVTSLPIPADQIRTYLAQRDEQESGND